MRSGRDTLRHRDSPGGVKWGGTRVAFKTRPHGHKLFRSVRPSPLFHPAVIKAAPSGGHRGRYFHATAGCLLQRLASPRPPSRCSGRSLVLIESKQSGLTLACSGRGLWQSSRLCVRLPACARTVATYFVQKESRNAPEGIWRAKLRAKDFDRRIQPKTVAVAKDGQNKCIQVFKKWNESDWELMNKSN